MSSVKVFIPPTPLPRGRCSAPGCPGTESEFRRSIHLKMRCSAHGCPGTESEFRRSIHLKMRCSAPGCPGTHGEKRSWCLVYARFQAPRAPPPPLKGVGGMTSDSRNPILTQPSKSYSPNQYPPYGVMDQSRPWLLFSCSPGFQIHTSDLPSDGLEARFF